MKPDVTPVTMLLTRVRVRPCSARWRGSSLGPHDAQLAVLALDAHLRVDLTLERAERALARVRRVPSCVTSTPVGERDRHASDA